LKKDKIKLTNKLIKKKERLIYKSIFSFFISKKKIKKT